MQLALKYFKRSIFFLRNLERPVTRSDSIMTNGFRILPREKKLEPLLEPLAKGTSGKAAGSVDTFFFKFLSREKCIKRLSERAVFPGGTINSRPAKKSKTTAEKSEENGNRRQKGGRRRLWRGWRERREKGWSGRFYLCGRTNNIFSRRKWSSFIEVYILWMPARYGPARACTRVRVGLVARKRV